MTTSNPVPPVIVPAASSAVRSAQSDDPNVYAICHHSWNYLTRRETNPRPRQPWEAQVEFPGMPTLDKAFAHAAHAPDQQHLDLEPKLMIVLAYVYVLLLGLGTWQILLRLGPGASLSTQIVSYTIAGLAFVVGIALLGWGISRTRQWINPALSQARPTVDDFPLLKCEYKLKVQENLTVTPANPSATLPLQAISHQSGRMTLEIYPPDEVVKDYSSYRHLYSQQGVGQNVFAGVLALENLKAVAFTPGALKHGHQLWLRQPIPPALQQVNYQKKSGPLLTFDLPYDINLDKLQGDKYAESRRVPLECVPKMSDTDSYTLELHFRWHGDPGRACTLEECRVDIPQWLPVERVWLGGYNASARQAVWQRLFLPKNESLVLRVTFGKPLLKLQNSPQPDHMLRGAYTCSVDGLVSGLAVKAENLWDARGVRVLYDTAPDIKCTSTIKGDLRIDTRRLQQEHEFVCGEELECPLAPNHALVHHVLHALSQCEVGLLRIEQAMPRLDPAGTLNKQLYYWDIVGRMYDPNMLISFDLHIVVTGEDYIINPTNQNLRTHIDLRVQCMHDPRDEQTPQRARDLLQKVQGELTSVIHRAVLHKP